VCSVIGSHRKHLTRTPEQCTNLVIFQLGSGPLAARSNRRHQPCPALPLELDHDGVNGGIFGVPHYDPAADLVEVGEAHVAGLIENDRGIHGSACPLRNTGVLVLVIRHHEARGVFLNMRVSAYRGRKQRVQMAEVSSILALSLSDGAAWCKVAGHRVVGTPRRSKSGVVSRVSQHMDLVTREAWASILGGEEILHASESRDKEDDGEIQWAE
jgi:hypothetical protein